MMPGINYKFKGNENKIAVVAHVLQNTLSLAITCCCFAEDGDKVYEDFYYSTFIHCRNSDFLIG